MSDARSSISGHHRGRHVAASESLDHGAAKAESRERCQRPAVVVEGEADQRQGRHDRAGADVDVETPHRSCGDRRPPLANPGKRPAGLNRNAERLEVWVFETNRAAWISSLKTTRTPSRRAWMVAATRTAASRFAGPSAPGSEGLRMAPVITIGVSPGHIRSRAKAVSSMVSVPCVTTTPAEPSATRWAISSLSLRRSAKMIDGEGRCMTESSRAQRLHRSRRRNWRLSQRSGWAWLPSHLRCERWRSSRRLPDSRRAAASGGGRGRRARSTRPASHAPSPAWIGGSRW